VNRVDCERFLSLVTWERSLEVFRGSFLVDNVGSWTFCGPAVRVLEPFRSTRELIAQVGDTAGDQCFETIT
jgi:hypothetical protein